MGGVSLPPGANRERVLIHTEGYAAFFMSGRSTTSGYSSLRKEQGLSQEGLAELAGMDRSFLSLVESGKRSISVENLCRLAAALEVHPRVFLEDA